jgi:guanylate kinase
MSGRGVLVIVSSPSGAGKTTLTKRLLTEFPNIEFSVSYTTRERRKNEVDGRDYHFINVDQFEEMVRNHEFAEHAFVHGNRYGTAKGPVDQALDVGRDIIFDVDWYGGANLAAIWPQDSLKIFILPPSIETLDKRLRERATDDPLVIERRVNKAHEELEHYNEYQHLIVNDDVERAYQLLRAIYLTRKFGVVDRTDVPYPLTELASHVAAAKRDAQAHAEKLVGR